MAYTKDEHRWTAVLKHKQLTIYSISWSSGLWWKLQARFRTSTRLVLKLLYSVLLSALFQAHDSVTRWLPLDLLESCFPPHPSLPRPTVTTLRAVHGGRDHLRHGSLSVPNSPWHTTPETGDVHLGAHAYWLWHLSSSVAFMAKLQEWRKKKGDL